MRLNQADWVQHDAGQVLQQIPGFSAVRKSGAYGFDPVFRGFKNEQLNILNDGAMGAFAACPNRMDPPTSQVMINQVQQVEIIRGPHSFRYGPASGAVINFKSADPAFSERTTGFGRITTGYEANGAVYRTEGMAGIRSAKLQLSAAGSFSGGAGYRDGNDSIIPATFNRGAGGLYLHYQPKKNHVVSLTATRNHTRNTDFPTLAMDLLGDDTWMIQAGFSVQSSAHWFSRWHTQLFTSHVNHSMGNGLRPVSKQMLSHVKASTLTSGGRTELTLPFKNSTLFTGTDFKYETADGNRTRSMLTGPMAGKTFIDTLWQKAQQYRIGLFVDWQLRQGSYTFLFAARLDAVQARSGITASTFSKLYEANKGEDLNFSVSAGASRPFGNKWQAGAWVGRDVRSASLTERFINSLPVGVDPYEMIGNPQLHAEENNQLDIQLAWRNEKTSFEWNGYAALVTNYITAVIRPDLKPRIASAPGVRQFINVPEARLLGFEATWNQKWTPKLKQQLTAVYTHGTNFTTKSPLPEIAPFDLRWKMEILLQGGQLLPYLQVRSVANQKRVARDFGENTTASFTTADLGIKWIPVQRLQVTAACNNLFDAAYREHLSRFIRPTLPLNAPGRTFVLMVGYQF
ncbi:MAG TPA: TonB-dependent receptor [Lacibacter sp.]|nr:TonB-dependent receptor [Lacibacter sp.]HMO89279.1 TonB-dependent receptor [Lacibacter sp.]